MCLLLAVRPQPQWDPRASLWNASQGTFYSCWWVKMPVPAWPSPAVFLSLGIWARRPGLLWDSPLQGCPLPQQRRTAGSASSTHLLCDEGWGKMLTGAPQDSWHEESSCEDTEWQAQQWANAVLTSVLQYVVEMCWDLQQIWALPFPHGGTFRLFLLVCHMGIEEAIVSGEIIYMDMLC